MWHVSHAMSTPAAPICPQEIMLPCYTHHINLQRCYLSYIKKHREQMLCWCRMRNVQILWRVHTQHSSQSSVNANMRSKQATTVQFHRLWEIMLYPDPASSAEQQAKVRCEVQKPTAKGPCSKCISDAIKTGYAAMPVNHHTL